MEELNNIPEDFDSIERYAPTLFKIGKANPFAVPTNYFQELPDVVMATKSLELITPSTKLDDIPEGYFEKLPSFIQSQAVLSDINKENPFAVPADYFEYLPHRIQEKIHAKKESWINILIAKLLSPRIAYALSITAIITIAGIYYLKQENKIEQTNPSLADLNKNTLTETVLDINMDEHMLVSELTSADIEVDENKLNTNKEDITEYLLENNVDINTIVNEM